MEQQDQQHDEKPLTEYPRGRGYGHDYMRGGEVFGGYGYSDRDEYERPRGAGSAEGAGADPADREPAGDIDVDTHEGAAEPGGESSRQAHQDGRETGPGAVATATQGDTAPPVPLLEHTYGSTGGNLRHSRSFYVTQAQLQQRIYGPQRSGQGPYHDRLRTIVRDDADIKNEVEERLFYDTWVDAQRIAVHVANATVTLSGALASEEEIRLACDDAWGVAGVREVRSELRAGDGTTSAVAEADET